MYNMNFSIVLITKNEEKTLPRLMESLTDYRNKGGEIVICDTGSTDKTVEVAKYYGCKVEEVGEKFIKIIDEETAKKINERFVIDGEEPIVKAGNRLFDFASARNYVSSLASNDMICTLDADEAYTRFDIDKINELIEQGFEQFEYQFVYAHDVYGKPAIQFVQSKFFDRRKVKWEGVVHEVLMGNAKRLLLGPEIIMLEHWQEQGKDHRGNYLVGLALDCFENQNKDRQSHYLARELLWTGRPRSAIKEFERHIAMNGWQAEKAQSMIFIGDAYGMINQPEKQVEWYNRAFYNDSNRREALIKLARFYKHQNNYHAVCVYAKASLEIPWTDYYANDKKMYEDEPYALLYWAYGWLGDIQNAQKHILKALEYSPCNPEYLRDTQFYFEYGANNVDGWMTFPELKFLYESSKNHKVIAELGSWKGRSTHALLTGTKGVITAIDTWEGSQDKGDATNEQAKKDDIYEIFRENTKEFENLNAIKGRGSEVVKNFADKTFDMVFIDAGHTYEEVKEDIENWLPKAKMLISGHDYYPRVWDGVVKAVDEKFGKPDGVAGTIWYKYLVPRVTFIIPTLGRPEGLKRCLDSIANLNYPKELIQTIVLDGEGTVPEKVEKGLWQATGEYIVYGSNDCEFTPDSLYIALQEKKGLVAFNTGYVGPDEGNICEHFIISKDLIRKLNGQIFDTEFHHIGVDNLLWNQAKKLNEAVRCNDAVVHHHHFSQNPEREGFEMDEVYKKGYANAEEDRKLLAKKLKEL